VLLASGSFARQLLVAMTLSVSLRAFGDHLWLPVLIVIITLAGIIGGISPSPGGMGVVEAGMIPGLTAAGAGGAGGAPDADRAVPGGAANHDDGTSSWSGPNATWLMAAAGHRVVRTSDTGHTGTISLTVRGAPRPQNAMKPRFQRVLTRWKPDSTASGTRASFHDQHRRSGIGQDYHDVPSSWLSPGLRRVAGGGCGTDAPAEVPEGTGRPGAHQPPALPHSTRAIPCDIA